MTADLHIHTNFSDGTDTPEEIVVSAKAAGLSIIAITDHDVVAGVPAALNKGKEIGVEVIPAIEFTTETSAPAGQTGSFEIHILGYFIDWQNAILQETLRIIQEGRAARIYKICEKLNKLGVPIDPEQVFKQAGHRAPGRPHVARVLMAMGEVSNFKEAFNRYLEFKGPAYIPHYKLLPAEAIKLITQVGGVAVFAHPAVSNCDDQIPSLIEKGLAGIEAYYGSYGKPQTEHYLELAKKYHLLVTGGSDFHGKSSGREIKLGEVAIDDKFVNELKNKATH